VTSRTVCTASKRIEPQDSRRLRIGIRQDRVNTANELRISPNVVDYLARFTKLIADIALPSQSDTNGLG
jgi:hypothetical protein